MAKLDVVGFSSLFRGLSNLEFNKIAPKMLEEAAPILERNIKHRASSHKRTGAMLNSISTGKIKKSEEGYRISVRPTGRDSKGVRNMEKMVYLEYGTHRQNATPVLSPAVAESEEIIYTKMQEVFDRQAKDMQI